MCFVMCLHCLIPSLFILLINGGIILGSQHWVVILIWWFDRRKRNCILNIFTQLFLILHIQMEPDLWFPEIGVAPKIMFVSFEMFHEIDQQLQG